jgi:Fe-S cluster biogenesis protein NfuA
MMPAAIAPSTVDVPALERRLAQVCAVMRSHAGAVELVEVGLDGVVELRFTGMCQGCPFRPLTMHGTIVPALMEVPGVTEVRAAGARISEFAAERLRVALGDRPPHLPVLPALPPRS